MITSRSIQVSNDPSSGSMSSDEWNKTRRGEKNMLRFRGKISYYYCIYCLPLFGVHWGTLVYIGEH